MWGELWGVLAMLLVALPMGCSRVAPDHASAPATSARVSARALFCAFGGVGIVPDPPPPDFEGSLAVVAIEVQNPGPAVAGLSVQDVVLLDAAGRVTPLRRVRRVDVLSSEDPHGRWAFYLDDDAPLFDGTLKPGTTRLRVRVSLKTEPSDPQRFRLVMGGLAAPLVVEGPVDGAWPT